MQQKVFQRRLKEIRHFVHQRKGNVRLNFIPAVLLCTTGSLFISDRYCQKYEEAWNAGCPV